MWRRVPSSRPGAHFLFNVDIASPAMYQQGSDPPVFQQLLEQLQGDTPGRAIKRNLSISRSARNFR